MKVTNVMLNGAQVIYSYRSCYARVYSTLLAVYVEEDTAQVKVKEEEYERLEQENTALKREIRKLSEEVKHLSEALKDHERICPLIHCAMNFVTTPRPHPDVLASCLPRDDQSEVS
ncbi:basic leucine zipper transcriptional factor ATF-like 3 isoform X3 [Heterodontus francisci]|uniref:basic leucine zipper transcriptional factor ATF-like 3 isoform X3 n=1 Tax=Heterodontus francisci TaxID=7792 RepID=UPI00355B4B5C